MYTFSNKLRTGAIILMVIGLIGVVYSIFSAKSMTVEDVKKELAEAHGAHGNHGSDASHASDKTHVVDSHDVKKEAAHTEEHGAHDTHADEEEGHTAEEHATEKANAIKEIEKEEAHHNDHSEDHHGAESHEDEHAAHILALKQNRPWSALYVAIFFFFIIALGVLAFYAINNVAQAGWPIVLFRVMEAIASYLPIGAVLLFVFLLMSSYGHMNHLFHWMDPSLIDPNNPHYDKLLANKTGWLNIPWFLIRAVLYIAGWWAYLWYAKKQSRAMDTASDNKNYKRIFGASAAFLVFFLITESMMSWDWIMSLDHHWFSTLFGWYIFAGMMVCGITTIALITIYLKSRGYLEYVNDSHLHDLAKFMFAFSIFWTYLWFSQFMLIWYANIPEEGVYYVARFNDYKLPFLGMLGLNFLFPVLMLMNSDYKRIPWFIVMAGIVILFGHYIDIFVMIMPATVGDQWFIGIPELSALLFVLGLFIYVVFNALTKAPLLAKRNPFIHESEHFHY